MRQSDNGPRSMALEWRKRLISKRIPDTLPAISCFFVGAIPFGRVTYLLFEVTGLLPRFLHGGKRNVKNRRGSPAACARPESGTTIFVLSRRTVPMHLRSRDKPANCSGAYGHLDFSILCRVIHKHELTKVR